MIFKNEELTQEFERTGALLKGHFLLSSGLHSSRYLQCAKILQHPDLAGRIGESLADKVKDFQIDVVAAPAIGGILVAHETGRALGLRAVFSERENNKMTFRRGLEIKQGEKVMVVEDVITTGGSIKETITAVQEAGGEVVVLGSIIDRSNGKFDLGIPYKSLLQVDVPAYGREDCPECKKGTDAIKPGSRQF